MRRHFTVTAFVSAEGKTLLHWHQKNQMWLPPGGHIEPDEDPYQAVLREAEEETGLSVVIIQTVVPYQYNEPQQLPPPVTIMIEDIPANPSEPAHQHLDLIYFTRPRDHDLLVPSVGAWCWVSEETLRENRPIAPGDEIPPVPVPEDVRVLGLAAIRCTAKEIAKPC
ncbi:MAG: NUDIX domain-containing protein [Dehalococcoidia bacterium]